MFGNFGGTSGFGSFGQNKPATSTFASSGSTLFGNPTNTGFSTTASTNVFGQPQASGTSNIFGGFNQAKPATGIFGTSQPSTMFGQPNRLPGAGTGGIFSGGTTTTVSPFSATGQTQQQGTSIPFNPITGNDTMMRNGVASAISTRNQCITCMKEYENKSLEELRLEDYQLGRKGPSQTNVFGGGQQQTAGGMFPLGQSTGTTTTFGQQTPAFGATAGQTSSLFTSMNPQKPQTSFFPNTGTATSAFGGTTFPFNTSTSQPSLFPTSSVTTSGVGSFQFPSSSQPQQQPSLGIFGAKTTTAAFGANTFNTATNTTINKPVPLFGGTGTSFGTTTSTAFGQQPSLFPTTSQPQNKPAFSFGPTFGAQPTSQSAFGSTAFPTWSNTTSNASLNLGTGGFGTTGTSGFPSFGTTTTNFQSPITNTGFGANTFTGLGTTNTNTSGLSLFNQSATLGTAPQNFNTGGGPAPFGTTPYKDSPLFYNLVTNRSVEDMTKPTNPVAQRQIREASRRKTSSLNSKNVVTSFTFPVQKVHSKKESFFDGFEEEDQGTAIDILSPKTSVKKLNIKNLRGFSRSSLNTSSFNGSVVEEPSVNEDGGSKANDSQVLNSSSNGLNASVSELFIHRAQPKESGDLNESSSSEGPSDSYYVAVNNQNGNGNETYNESYQEKSNSEAAHEQYSSYDGAQNHPCGVKYTRSGYYISPDIKELDLLTDAQGNCFVRGFIVGRHNYGEIRFLDVVNVGNLDIDETVLFRHKEVVVYPDDNNKPPVGEGINVPAEIRLERVWPIDKATKDPIKVPAKVKALKYEEKLKKSCERLGAEFISYDEQTGRWVFKVSHFSKYSCAPEEEEDEDVGSATEIPKGGGLGGKTVQNLKSFVGPTQALIIEEDSEGRIPEPPKTFRPEPMLISQETDVALPERPHLGGGGEPCTPEGTLEPVGPKNGVPEYAVISGAIAGGDNVVDMFGSMEEKVDDFPDYFGLATDVMKPSVPEVSPAVLSKLQSAKVPQHRKRDEIPFLDAVWKQTKFLALYRFPQSNARKGARVAFGPLGNYIRVVNKSKDYPRANRFIGQVKVEKLTPYREIMNRGESSYSQFYANILTKQLVLMMEHSSPNNLYKLRPEGIIGELIKTLLDDEELQKWQDDQNAAVAEPHYIATCKEELQLWLLCNILWPCEELSEAERQDKGFLIEYRIRLAEWFKTNAKMLFGDQYDPEDTSLKGLLKKGMHLEACELAVEQGNFNLALNLAQCCGESQKAMQIQMDEWEAQGMVDFIPKDVLELYRLCTGLPIWDDIDIKNMSTCEWLQHFAIYLWYICPMNYSIEEAVINFQTLVVESAQRDLDIEYPSRLDSSIANTCIHLLKSYVNVGYKIRNLLNPRTNNPDCLDYKLSWFLMHNLKQLGYHPDPDLVEDLTVGFAGQLENMGLFHWAIYVLKTLPPTVARDVMIDRILERNVTSSMRVRQEKPIEFIETLLEVPRTHIEAHCFRA